MFKRSYVMTSAAVVAVALTLLNLPDRSSARLKWAAGSLFLPLFGLAGSGQQLIRDASAGLVSSKRLITELEDLRRQNRELRLMAAQGSEAQAENARLRQLLGRQSQLPWKTKPGRVIGRDTANWWRTARIDLGSRDGLRSDLPVFGIDGLVGKTGEVGLTTAEVIFLGDPKCRVAVVVRETGEQGVISATSVGVWDHRLVDLTHLPRHTLLRPAQSVYTSGLGGVFPAGLPVGSIVDHRSVGYGLYTEARVKLAEDTSRLREVLVILP